MIKFPALFFTTMKSFFYNVKRLILVKAAVRANVLYGSMFHVGPGSVIWAPSRLRIGSDVYVGKNVTIQVDGLIGDGVLFANGCGVVGRKDHDYLEVGATVRSAAWVGDFPDKLSTSVVIGSDVWIGFNAIVYSGVTIGNSVVVAAGSVVTSSVPDNCVVAGSPARVLRSRYSESDFEDHWRALRVQGVRWIESEAVV